jgi:prophage regulatory protein
MEPISLIRMDEVKRRVGLGRSAIYSLISRGLFPAPITIQGTRVSVWDSSAIQAWCETQLSLGETNHA